VPVKGESVHARDVVDELFARIEQLLGVRHGMIRGIIVPDLQKLRGLPRSRYLQ
jgi:hypothetical protein